MFESIIKINASKELANAISQVLEPEQDFKTERASYDLKLNEKGIEIKVRAEDATAFRAVMSSITSLISIVEKIWRETHGKK